MNKHFFNTLPTTTSNPDFLIFSELTSTIKDIFPVIDSSSNILNSVTRIIESNNNKNVSLASMYYQYDYNNQKIQIDTNIKKECLKNCNEQFYAILNSDSSEEFKKELLLSLIKEECKNLWLFHQ